MGGFCDVRWYWHATTVECVCVYLVATRIYLISHKVRVEDGFWYQVTCVCRLLRAIGWGILGVSIDYGTTGK